MGIKFTNIGKAIFRITFDNNGETPLNPNTSLETTRGDSGRVYGHPRYLNGIPFSHTDQKAWVLKEGHKRLSTGSLVPKPGFGPRAIRNSLRRGEKHGSLGEGLVINFSPDKESK